MRYFYDRARKYLKSLRFELEESYTLYQQEREARRKEEGSRYEHVFKENLSEETASTKSSCVASCKATVGTASDAEDLAFDTCTYDIVIRAGLIAQARRRHPSRVPSLLPYHPRSRNRTQTDTDRDVLKYFIDEFQARSNSSLTPDDVRLVRMVRAALYEIPVDAGRAMLMGDEEEHELMERKVLLALQRMRRMIRDVNMTI
jgi:hypothetical protein